MPKARRSAYKLKIVTEVHSLGDLGVSGNVIGSLFQRNWALLHDPNEKKNGWCQLVLRKVNIKSILNGFLRQILRFCAVEITWWVYTKTIIIILFKLSGSKGTCKSHYLQLSETFTWHDCIMQLDKRCNNLSQQTYPFGRFGAHATPEIEIWNGNARK